MSYERANIRDMQGYTAGEQPLDSDAIKLNTNENPWPPAPAIADAIKTFDPESLRRYPPPTALEFRKRAAVLHGVAADNIIATRGGDELLRLVITTFVEPGEPIGMSEPTYSLYPVLARIQDCPVVKVPLNADWSLANDFAERLNAANVKLALIVNPHAPSGRLLDEATLRRLAAALNGLLLVDEAYVDFVDEKTGYDATSLVREFDNVIILRTLSKGYSLAGLRVGYGVGAESLIKPMMEKTRDSYNLDAFSQKIAETALAHRDHAVETWKWIRAERAVLQEALRSLGWTVPDSHANFMLATVTTGPCTAEQIYHRLKAAGILVRYFDHPGLDDKLRITVGTPAQNARLMETLRGILASS